MHAHPPVHGFRLHPVHSTHSNARNRDEYELRCRVCRWNPRELGHRFLS